MKRWLAPLAAFALAGCGLHPLYDNGGSGTVGSTLSHVQVAPIEGRDGWLMANALRDRLMRDGGTAPQYQLKVVLDDSITGLGVRRDDAITRERRSLRARYELVDLATGKTVFEATAGSDAGIDVVGSEYATIAAEQTSLENLTHIVADQIVSRLALYVRENAKK
ncbi:LPS assembly lipoprotein LptE [Stakelama sediminis]|uniref:LPS-assembly lipoprotein n=1 Tax=Stakelama sediminis TaxID=463200 RepID=A0A840YZX4_9SPHN|nr:LPS assembly lipoprotein LptE [Stakelama sediminis]MBB5719258.1 LPS-assembly lipoprotein [Stakelama sediminis]